MTQTPASGPLALVTTPPMSAVPTVTAVAEAAGCALNCAGKPTSEAAMTNAARPADNLNVHFIGSLPSLGPRIVVLRAGAGPISLKLAEQRNSSACFFA